MITRLKIEIIDSGLKQKHIAKKIGIDHTLLSKYVTGERELPPNIAKKIAKLLQVSAECLGRGRR